MFWKVKLSKFALHFGGSNETLEFKDDDKDVVVGKDLKHENRIIFDSGTSYTIMPNSRGDVFAAEVNKRGLKCNYNYGSMMFNCPC